MVIGLFLALFLSTMLRNTFRKTISALQTLLFIPTILQLQVIYFPFNVLHFHWYTMHIIMDQLTVYMLVLLKTCFHTNKEAPLWALQYMYTMLAKCSYSPFRYTNLYEYMYICIIIMKHWFKAIFCELYLFACTYM